jgi:hypothetical protein
MPLRRPQMTQDFDLRVWRSPTSDQRPPASDLPAESPGTLRGDLTAARPSACAGTSGSEVQHQHPMCESLDTQRRRIIAQTTSFTTCAAQRRGILYGLGV